MDGQICSYLERESRTSLIAGQGQSNGGRLLLPREDPRTPQLLSAYDNVHCFSVFPAGFLIIISNLMNTHHLVDWIYLRS